jgi:ergothioneine biosynthesis protein EgtB
MVESLARSGVDGRALGPRPIIREAMRRRMMGRERAGRDDEPCTQTRQRATVDPVTISAERTERQTIARFTAVRQHTERLAAPLGPEDQTVQSMPDVSPTKWHRAHTTWFFEAFVLGVHQLGYEVFDPDFAYLFNSYYEGLGERHPRAQRGLLTRPGVDEVAAYRAHVDDAVVTLLDSGPAPEVLDLIELGLQHEQQHQELLTMDIKHVLGVNPLRPIYDERPSVPVRSRELTWLAHDGGLVEVGHDGRGFAFDNEAPRHRAHLEPFLLGDRPVTNGEWLAFMADDGYSRAELWLSEGWVTVNAEGWQAPLYWRGDGDVWSVHTLHGVGPVDLDRPVSHVSHFEADAFARWAGARLPTEKEWEVLGATHPDAWPDPTTTRPELEPTMPERESSPLALGEVWEWTASAYLPYPGFHPAAGAVGEYNGKFMVNQHVLRGGCSATPSGHARLTYRNFFPSASRWVFSGVRLARDQ